MNSHRRSRWGLPAMLVLLVAPAGAACAADGEVTFGTQWWDQTAREAKFEEFRDIPNGPFLESFVVRDTLRNGRYALFGTDAFQNDQATTLQYRRPRWTAGIEYTRTPHNFSFIARTPYAEIAPGIFTLPDTLQRRIQEDPANQATNTLLDMTRNSRRVPLGFRTDRTEARLKARMTPGFQLDVRGSRRQRQGTKAYGGSFGFGNVVEITEPIRQTIAQGEARVSYVRRRVALEALGGVDAFQNDVDALVFDNPRRYTDSPTAGSSRGRTDLYPDNNTIRGALKAGVQLPHRTALTAYVGLSQITQNDRWLPMTINTAILQPDTFPLPGAGTAGKANVLTGDVRLTGSPSRYVTGTLRYRHYDYDNKTTRHVIPGQVAYDQSWQPAPVATHPIGFKNTVYGADVSLTPDSRVALTGTAEHTLRDRTFREVARDNEWAFEGKARVRPRTGIEVEGRYRHADRKLDHFEEADYQDGSGVFVEQPTLRRFDVGDRQQEQARGLVGWTPNDRFQISAGYEYLRNKYEDRDLPGIGSPLSPDTSETQLGLLDETRRSISADASYQLTDRVEVSGGYGWTQVYTNQRSRESNSALVRLDDSTAWQARLNDWFVYATGAVTWRAIPDRISVVGTYEFERSPGIYHLTNFRRTAIDLPGTKYRRQSVGAEGWYTFDAGTSLGARWTWEEFSVTDFATEDVPLVFPVTGASNAIFLGDSMQDYRAHVLALLLRKTF
jgi:MtrB/PioB family decaheme-associated outer membrane protein